MSLRLRLFLAFAALLAVLGLLAAWGIARLDRALESALGETALEVGHSVVTVLRDVPGDGAAPTDPMDRAGVAADLARARSDTVRRVHVVVGDQKAPEDIAAAAAHGFHFRLDAPPGDAAPRLLLRGGGLERAIPLPQQRLQDAVRGYSAQLAWGLGALLLLGLLLAAWLARRIAAPLQGLAGAAQRLAGGEHGATATESGAPEVRATIAAFNRMSQRLSELDAEAGQLREQQALAELGEIGRGLAHALRNPLHAVGLAVEAMAEPGTPRADAARLAATARAQLSRIDQSLRGFLALAAGEGAVPVAVDVRGVVEDVLLEASQRTGQRLALRLADGAPCTLSAVPAELRILVHTLVVNAAEASDGLADSAVEVQVEPGAGGGCQVRVLDRGRGVPDSLQGRLFTPHVSSKADGAGMGLYLAQRLVALRYAGGIVLAPRDGGGTAAVLTLFARRCA